MTTTMSSSSSVASRTPRRSPAPEPRTATPTAGARCDTAPGRRRWRSDLSIRRTACSTTPAASRTDWLRPQRLSCRRRAALPSDRRVSAALHESAPPDDGSRLPPHGHLNGSAGHRLGEGEAPRGRHYRPDPDDDPTGYGRHSSGRLGPVSRPSQASSAPGKRPGPPDRRAWWAGTRSATPSARSPLRTAPG